MSRDDQFKDFAERLFEELKPDLVLLCVELGRRNTAGILQSEEIIKQQLARRAYDLVAHAIHCNGIHPKYWHGGMQASDIYMREVAKEVNAIPDLPTLPEEQAE